MTKRQDCFVVEPVSPVNASVIWLHGLGAYGKDFVGIIDQLGLPPDHGVRFIFPNAPFMNITINYGMSMRAWYDIYELVNLDREDEQGIKSSQARITDLIQHELAQGIISSRVMLAGFSQGGAMSLYTGLNFQQQLAGIIVLSAYLPLANQLQLQQLSNKLMPIFIAHGLFDPVVPFSLGQAARDLLIKENYVVDWHTYPTQHTVCLEEIAAIGGFVRRCLGYA